MCQVLPVLNILWAQSQTWQCLNHALRELWNTALSISSKQGLNCSMYLFCAVACQRILHFVLVQSHGDANGACVLSHAELGLDLGQVSASDLKPCVSCYCSQIFALGNINSVGTAAPHWVYLIKICFCLKKVRMWKLWVKCSAGAFWWICFLHHLRFSVLYSAKRNWWNAQKSPVWQLKAWFMDFTGLGWYPFLCRKWFCSIQLISMQVDLSESCQFLTSVLIWSFCLRCWTAQNVGDMLSPVKGFFVSLKAAWLSSSFFSCM